MQDIEIEFLSEDMSVCKVTDYTSVNLLDPFTFTGATDKELSLVCPTKCVPGNVLVHDDGWAAFRLVGTFEFSLIGILSRISTVLSEAGVGIFAISTFDTDYVLIKRENEATAREAFTKAGYKLSK